AEGQQTNHFVVSDAEGNVASYTNTINFYGGSGILVPGRGFLLNNELTDFDFAASAPGADDPNLPAPGKRPRSSMSPTIVLQAGKPYLALGSPGGSTIITTVLQVLMNRIDLGMSLQDAVAAPRAS
ncbi:gamma-glutamyltransferase family protein, partial [Escherichia coli]|nr:gamma-glutamyltransferase family protein [Escherichia coli]